MNTWELSDSKRSIEERYGKPNSVELLSNSNNPVWKVAFNSDVFVVKEIVDQTLDVISERDLLRYIGNSPLFRPIFDVIANRENGRKIVIYPFIEGVSLDVVLRKDKYSLNQANHWSSQMIQSFEILKNIKVHRWGRGLYSNNKCYDSWLSFFFSYLKEQRLKGPQIAELRYDDLINVINKYKKSIEKEVKQPSLVCGDVNARNYLISADGNLICIHTPMVWRSDPAVPYGDALVHLDRSLFGDCFNKLSNYPCYRMWLYAAFSAYVILVYIERYSNEPLAKALPWGRGRPLLEILDFYLDILN